MATLVYGRLSTEASQVARAQEVLAVAHDDELEVVLNSIELCRKSIRSASCCNGALQLETPGAKQ